MLSISSMANANVFLAAFAAGITVATIGPEVRQSFHQFGELVAELLKLAALLVFGALISPRFLGEIPVSGYVFGILVLVALRPIAISLSLMRSSLDWRERGVAAWFGPKGFASVDFSIRNVGRQHEGFAAGFLDLALRTFEALLTTGDQSDVGFSLGKFSHRGPSHARRCTGDNDDFR